MTAGKFTLDSTGPHPKVTIAGEDIPGVQEVHIRHVDKEFASVVLVLASDQVAISGHGNLTVAPNDQGVVSFLEQIDVKQLETAVMARTSFNSNVFADAKAVLLEWANASR